MIDKSELLEYFLSEAVDHINILERGISELEMSPDKSNLIEELFRVAHTLKGSAALVNLTITSTIAHKMEDILEGLMNKKIKVNNKIVESLSYMLDGIKSLIYRISKGSDEYLETEQIILQRAEKVLTDEQATTISSDAHVSEIIHPLPSILKSQEIADSKALQKSHKPRHSLTHEMGEKFGRRKDDSEFLMGEMVDIGILFQRFVKSVKDMAKKHNKEIELLISGGLTKIDRVVFERLFSPLMHLIMNAISHGIESADERLQKNKKTVGTIILSARKEGGTAVIEVTDDGRGIDTENIFKEAVRQGLLSADDKPSKEDILSLIFIPGFSTAETTDMVAGRGMGMSTVRRMIADINGILEVSTEAGNGTTFRIKVPLSLAISNVLLFRSGMLEFVIPSSFIEEVMLLSDAPEKGLIDHRGKKIKVMELSSILGIGAKSDSPDKYAIVCNVSDKKVGLIVDAVIGQEETIIKTMDGFLEGLQIYSGTTISGDGSIRFVLNPVNIFEE